MSYYELLSSTRSFMVIAGLKLLCIGLFYRVAVYIRRNTARLLNSAAD